ncbi:MAG: carbamoyl-phosphate synthase domain-containing protein, partial [bacterium]
MNVFLNGFLILEDGTVWRGRWEGTGEFSVGEVVFNTAMSGYQEVVTDPSYAGQIVVMTYPHIGTVGVNKADAESSRPHLLGLVVRSLDAPSNWRSEGTLRDYLKKFNVPVLTEVDTRS